MYDWARVPLWRLQMSAEKQRWGPYLLIRRSLDETPEYAFYVAYAPRRWASRQTLVEVAERRWEIEIGFEAAKGECGLDHYEVRKWQGWYRHITLSLLAHAVLVVLRAKAKKNAQRHDRAERARVAPSVIETAMEWWPFDRAYCELVGMATRASAASSSLPLSTASVSTGPFQSTAVVLGLDERHRAL